MKIGICNWSTSFSERWLEYLKNNGIDFKIVNSYGSDIIEQLADCDAFMWEHNDGSYRDILFAKQLLYSLQVAGKTVFPSFNTGWFYNDKIGQKYLLESIGAPLAPANVFYDKNLALEWVNHTTFPKVFKLRGGAGSSNVKLVYNKRQARRIVHKSFSRGFSQLDRWGYFKEKLRTAKEGRDPIINVLKGLSRLCFSSKFAQMVGREKGYVYFQEFIPNNSFDVRVVIIGEKAIALKRMNRQNDFRASGSGNIDYNKDQIDVRCIQIAFDVNKRIKSQCLTFDFVVDLNNNPLIVEIGFAFTMYSYDKCSGYWDSSMNWYNSEVKPQYWMIENLLDELRIQVDQAHKEYIK